MSLRWSRRLCMYLLVGLQLGVLGLLVAREELNRALDRGPAVDLEIAQASASKDPFRGAAVRGRPRLDTTGTHAEIAAPLSAGDEVLVFFVQEPDKAPRIARVDRRGWGPDPLFSPELFSIPGRVLPQTSGRTSGGSRGITVRVGSPAVTVELNLPETIPIAETALPHLATPSPLRVSLRRGAFGHRYLADVRLAGQGFPFQMHFAYAPEPDRLAVLTGKGERFEYRSRRHGEPPASTVYLFDGTGKEATTAETPGLIADGIYSPKDGAFLVVVSPERYLSGPVQLGLLRLDGGLARKSPQIHAERLLGFDPESGGAWAVAGTDNPTTHPRAPFFVQRFGLDGWSGPRIGPLASRPRSALTADRHLFVVESDQHRIGRFDMGGSLVHDYRNLNRPAEIAVHQGDLLVVEANQTQLSRYAPDGSVRWQVPRFQGLAWVVPDPATGGGWVGATRYENAEGGVFRFEADGRVRRLPLAVSPRAAADWTRPRLAGDAIADPARGRLYVRETQAVAILGTDGTLLSRVDGFRFATPRPLPQ